MNTEQIIHDLAVVYAQEKMKEFFDCVDVESRPFPSDIYELVNFYTAGVVELSKHTHELKDVYKDVSKNEVL